MWDHSFLLQPLMINKENAPSRQPKTSSGQRLFILDIPKRSFKQQRRRTLLSTVLSRSETCHLRFQFWIHFYFFLLEHTLPWHKLCLECLLDVPHCWHRLLFPPHLEGQLIFQKLIHASQVCYGSPSSSHSINCTPGFCSEEVGEHIFNLRQSWLLILPQA